jgi:hypothetical protein
LRPPSKADIELASCNVRFTPKSGHSSAQRFDEAPKLDGGLGSATVPVIAIPLAFRRAQTVGPSPVGSLRQLRTHSVQGAVRIHETELSHSVISVVNLTETTLYSATGPFRSDGIGI